MKLKISIVVFVTVSLVSSTTQTALQDKLVFKPTQRIDKAPLTEVGVFNNKKFYAGNLVSTWSQSLEICHLNGKVAAVIESRDELNKLALKLKYSNEYLPGYFWTAGHDLVEEGKFQWFHRNSPVDLKLPVKFVESLDRNCVQLHFQGYLFDWVCDDLKALPLCQDP
ncbi:unnamed protein product [Allacma fusca]|uniref:C-type lectin domain-containing protein n=1 Tax=Allacma fusca TaxID=39272 RepID=A0A8J2JKP6_9HEXA|nr:unnamed protein product [Allacma fusca]